MNRFTFASLLLFLLVAGCAARPNAAQQPQLLARERQPAQPVDDPPSEAVIAAAQFSAPASALVFDLPVARDLPPLNLDRQSREPAAFVGFEGPSAEYHTVLINNTQCVGNCGYGDSYQRQDLIERTSVRYR